MARTLNRSGQALVEWALLLPLYGALIFAIVIFGKWFCIKQQLIFATREAAYLYSSGRMTAPEVQRRIQQSLAHGSPGLILRDEDISVGRREGVQARMWELDQISIRFQVPDFWKSLFKFEDMEEVCVIKHAPTYGAPFSSLGFPYGRPVDW